MSALMHIVSPRTMSATSSVGMLAGLLLCFCQACQTGEVRATPGQAPPTPVVRVTGDRGDFDLGTVTPGSTHTVNFDIVNSSARPLKLLRMQSLCDCIRVLAAPKEISAGDVGHIETSLKAPDSEGPYRTEVVVLTDAPDRKVIRLGVRCLGRK